MKPERTLGFSLACALGWAVFSGCATESAEKDLSITRDSRGNITGVTETPRRTEPVLPFPNNPATQLMQEESTIKSNREFNPR